jgi:NitT/TauT family transport system substrate-binding protein
MGLSHLLNLQDIKGIKGLYMIGGINAAYAEKNPDVITNYYKAYQEAVLLSRKEKEKTKKALSKWTKVEDQEALEFAYNYFVDFWPTDSHIPNDEIQFILDQLAATTNPVAKDVKLDSIVDYKYIDAIK